MHSTWTSRVVAGLAIAALIGGCSAVAAKPPSTVKADLSEFKIGTDSAQAAAGSVTFAIKNGGSVVHEFVVVRSDLASDKLPLSAEGKVDEASTDLKNVDEVEDIAAGGTPTLTVTLEPGRYILICNLPGHYKGGMHQSLEVLKSS
jgi:uncharacterized cupredoxin-like copper-binding protein